MNAPTTSVKPTGGNTAKTNALKTVAVNFIIAFAGYWGYSAAKEWYETQQASKTTKS